VTFNLVRFFGSDGRTLLDVALSLAGQRTTSRKVTLRLVPSIDTDAGRIRYRCRSTWTLLRDGGTDR